GTDLPRRAPAARRHSSSKITPHRNLPVRACGVCGFPPTSRLADAPCSARIVLDPYISRVRNAAGDSVYAHLSDFAIALAAGAAALAFGVDLDHAPRWPGFDRKG